MINIFNLNYKRDEKEIKKVETYRKILEKIHNKIKNNSKKSVTHLVYIIPKFIAGLPAYDQIKCAEYCHDRLKKNGFVIMYTYPNMLFISWEHVPSRLKNPNIKPIEYEITTNPYKDYSKIVHQLSNITDNSTNNNNPLAIEYGSNTKYESDYNKNDFYENNNGRYEQNIISNNSNLTYFLENSN